MVRNLAGFGATRVKMSICGHTYKLMKVKFDNVLNQQDSSPPTLPTTHPSWSTHKPPLQPSKHLCTIKIVQFKDSAKKWLRFCFSMEWAIEDKRYWALERSSRNDSSIPTLAHSTVQCNDSYCFLQEQESRRGSQKRIWLIKSKEVKIG